MFKKTLIRDKVPLVAWLCTTFMIVVMTGTPDLIDAAIYAITYGAMDEQATPEGFAWGTWSVWGLVIVASMWCGWIVGKETKENKSPGDADDA